MTERVRDRDARERQIVDCARELAEQEGWDAVTTRRLSAMIGYSQPVLYSHFATMEDVMATAAVEGFAELATALRKPRRGADGVSLVARNYLAFAAENPALYDAMFHRTGEFEFGTGSSDGPLRDAFQVLREATGGDDAGAELLWATLHGLASLQLAGRVRPSAGQARIKALVSRFDGVAS